MSQFHDLCFTSLKILPYGKHQISLKPLSDEFKFNAAITVNARINLFGIPYLVRGIFGF
jgi:hypothetical protein